MCDKVLPQQALCLELSGLHKYLPAASVPTWWRAFWQVMGLEWTTGIDGFRMNKFLLLVRRTVGAMFLWPKYESSWDASASAHVLSLLGEFPFEQSGDLRKMPVGLRLHVLDIWVDELDASGMLAAASEDDKALDFVTKLSQSVEKLLMCPCKASRIRAKETLRDERLRWKGKDKPKSGDVLSGNTEQSTMQHLRLQQEEDVWNGFDD